MLTNLVSFFCVLISIYFICTGTKKWIKEDSRVGLLFAVLHFGAMLANAYLLMRNL